MGVRRSGVLALWAASFWSIASAQSTSLGVAPAAGQGAVNPWRPKQVCSAGSNYGGPAPYGGVYVDNYNAYWEVECGYAWTGTTYYDGSGPVMGSGIGTYSQGIVTCFVGCGNRIGR